MCKHEYDFAEMRIQILEKWNQIHEIAQFRIIDMWLNVSSFSAESTLFFGADESEIEFVDSRESDESRHFGKVAVTIALRDDPVATNEVLKRHNPMKWKNSNRHRLLKMKI